MKVKYLLISGLVLLVVAAALAACSGGQPAPTQAPCPTAAACPTCPTCPQCPTCPTAEPCPSCPEAVVKDVPFQDLWVASGHNDAEALAFNDWNEADPKEIPVACAKCHSTAGYQDFLGADGSEVGKVDKAVAAPAGTLQCVTCHNEAATNLTSVTFNSYTLAEDGSKVPVVVSGLGPEARCMVCHQGRASKNAVDDRIAQFKVEDLDAVVAPIKDDQGNDVRFGFINIHYYAAAATLYGNEVHGGYEYDGMMYDAKHDHVEGFNTCTGCHNPHSLKVKVEQCAWCHTDVKTVEDLKNVREPSSMRDYDGDGNTSEGMFYEIQGLQEMLYAQIQSYAQEKGGVAIVYDVATYPYWFADADGDGKPDQKEGANVAYNTWTARLLKAAYNYQVSVKDPGAFAHGNKYIVQLLYDSIADLGGDVSKLARDDAGHFAGNTEPFRHWDEAGRVVPGSCAKCHSATGLPQFLKEGTTISNPASNGFACTTCHDEANWPARYAVTEVTFPSGAKVTFSKPDADGKLQPDDGNLCLLCHQGRESTASVNTAIKASGAADADSFAAEGKRLSFRNVHYFAAGATLFGTEAKGAYEYEGKEYVGKHPHVESGFTCTTCHDVHALEVKTDTCAGCHPGKTLDQIRMSETDYDGDGDVTEGIAGEIATLQEALYAELQKYAESKGGAITYNAAAYPYFFGADGKAYAAWTPRLLKAAYNYQYTQKDPGAFAHNGKYTIQILIDSIQDLGGNVSAYTRP